MKSRGKFRFKFEIGKLSLALLFFLFDYEINETFLNLMFSFMKFRFCPKFKQNVAENERRIGIC